MNTIKVGVACDHGGFELKNILVPFLVAQNFEIKDFGAFELNNTDDFPDFVIPLEKAVAQKNVDRGIAICGSGVGAAVAANKIAGVRAALIHEHFSAHQGVEDDDMNLICLGGRVTGFAAAEELIMAFLNARYIAAERFERRLKKIQALEINNG
ncbi:MAG: RpiB/LacA/LacB family sugar-phosphate isomerase [Ginsengibacter sp.]